MGEQHYTLDEARREIARQTCDRIDHDWEIIQDGTGPIGILCTRCSKTYAIYNEPPRTRESFSYWHTDEGKLEQAIREGLRDADVDGVLALIVGPIKRRVMALSPTEISVGLEGRAVLDVRYCEHDGPRSGQACVCPGPPGQGPRCGRIVFREVDGRSDPWINCACGTRFNANYHFIGRTP